MSHRFKRSKPLGKNKKSMKNESAASQKQFPPEQDLAVDEECLYDFL